MKINFILNTLLILLIVMIGCEKEQLDKAKEQKAIKNKTTQEKNTEQRTVQTHTKEKFKPIDYKTLQKFLPDQISGYTKLEPTGATSNFEDFTFSTTEVLFTKNNGSTISVQILDYAGIEELYEPYDSWIKSSVNVEDEEGFARTTNIQGYHAFESYQKDLKTGQISVIIGERIIIDVNATELTNFEDLRKVINSIKLANIDSLIKTTK
ncbi:MAG: hypothetical protein N3A54_06550 [Patescibacteria group bacterium]|nr:hypothetical protein [Patescibacteria group bacterium]